MSASAHLHFVYTLLHSDVFDCSLQAGSFSHCCSLQTLCFLAAMLVACKKRQHLVVHAVYSALHLMVATATRSLVIMSGTSLMATLCMQGLQGPVCLCHPSHLQQGSPLRASHGLGDQP